MNKVKWTFPLIISSTSAWWKNKGIYSIKMDHCNMNNDYRSRIKLLPKVL